MRGVSHGVYADVREQLAEAVTAFEVLAQWRSTHSPPGYTDRSLCR